MFSFFFFFFFQDQCCYRLALFDETSSQWESIRTYEDRLVRQVSILTFDFFIFFLYKYIEKETLLIINQMSSNGEY